MKSFVAMVLLQVVLPGLAFAEEGGAPPLTAAHARTDGGWYGQCAKGGRTQNVSIDRAGAMAGN